MVDMADRGPDELARINRMLNFAQDKGIDPALVADASIDYTEDGPVFGVEIRIPVSVETLEYLMTGSGRKPRGR